MSEANIIVDCTGDIFECVKSNKQHGAVKGKFYVYQHGELKTFSSRFVDLRANGDEMLALPGVFVRAAECPFCKKKLAGAWEHDGVECAADWDARTKKYCRTCGADTVNGGCKNCGQQ